MVMVAQRQLAHLLCVVLVVVSISLIHAQTQVDSVGGGFVHGGMTGEYFANSNWAAPSAFTRRDIRLVFDRRTSGITGRLD